MKAILMTLAAVLASLCTTSLLKAEELMVNGDFETLEVEGEPPELVRDDFNNAMPTSWFRSTNNPPGVPLTELIGPENGDPATDSDGNGSYAAALNFDPSFQHSDWRSETFATTPGEEISWSFDFKFAEYAYDDVFNPDGVPEGFRIDLRSFQNANTGGTFAGEQTVYVYVHGYGPDTTGDGVGDSGGFAAGGEWPHNPASVTLMNFNDNQWHTLSTEIFGDIDDSDENDLWKIPVGGNFTDIRMSVNSFNFVLSEDFQLLMDNISAVRPSSVTPTGDYNGDGFVNAADYTVWRNTLGDSTELGAGADGNGNGEVDAGDYTFWKLHYGDDLTPGAGGLAVPEPTCLALVCIAAAFLSTRRQIR